MIEAQGETDLGHALTDASPGSDVSDTPGATGAVSGRFARHGPPVSVVVLIGLVVFGVGFGLVAYNLSLPHGLYGVTEYDDGVYLGAAIHFVAGQLPYRDFVFVQPPGITVVLAPLALFVGHIGAREAMAIARVATGVVTGANAVLVVILLRRRGALAALLGGLVLAVFPPAYTADHTLMLEPYLVLFCLIGVLLCFSVDEPASPRRLLAGGLAFGIAGSIKTFAAVIVVALVIVFLIANRRAAVVVLVGTVVGFILVCLPFFIAAPHGFIHDVISSQLSRDTPVPTPFASRLASITGLTYIASAARLHLGSDSPWPALAGSVLAAIFLFGAVIPAIFRRASTFTWFALAGAAAGFLLMLVPAQFFDHYSYFSAAFLAIVIGIFAGNITDGVRVLSRQRASNSRGTAAPRWPVGTLGVVVLLLTVSGAAALTIIESHFERQVTEKYGDPGPAIAKSIPQGASAVSDTESLLISANRVSTAADCPIVVDATGTWLAYDPANPPVQSGLGPKDPALVAFWKRVFEHVDYTTFAGGCVFRIPFTPALKSWFNEHFEHTTGPSELSYVRRPVPLATASGFRSCRHKTTTAAS